MAAKVQYEEMFPWEFAAALHQAPIGYLPLGVLEWHGEHNAVGLDALKAYAVCLRAAQRSGGIVLPLVYWAADSREDLPDGSYLTGGVESGERYHVPGNMFWIRPETFRSLLLDMFEAMRRRGFKVIMVVSGHWSTRVHLPVLHGAAEQFQAEHPEIRLAAMTDRDAIEPGLPGQENMGAAGEEPDLSYPHEHAAGAETSLLMAIRPDLVDLGMTFETDQQLRERYRGQPQHLQRRQQTRHKYIGVLTGVPDGGNDPETTASRARGERLLEEISRRIAARASDLLSEIGTG